MSRAWVSRRMRRALIGDQGPRYLLVALGAGAVPGAAVIVGLVDHGWALRAALLLAGATWLASGTAVATFLRTYLLRWEIANAVDSTAGAIWGLTGLHSPRGLPLPALGGYALRPVAAQALAREVIEQRPGVVVELGPGASTVIVELASRQQEPGPRIFSFEHDEEYVCEMEELIRSLDLSHVTVIHAALGEGRDTPWYDLAAFEHLPGEPIDMLIVDGPPDPKGMGTRRHAYPQLRGRLSERAVIFVDDTGRPTERAMVDEWLEDPKLQLKRDGGAYIVLVYG